MKRIRVSAPGQGRGEKKEKKTKRKEGLSAFIVQSPIVYSHEKEGMPRFLWCELIIMAVYINMGHTMEK